MKKIKYLFITLIIALVGFLAFSIRNYLPILALGNVSIQENDTFSSDILIDMEYYNSLDSDSDNILRLNDKQGVERNVNYTISNGIITLNGITNSSGNVILINDLGLTLEANKTYFYKGFVSNVGTISGTTLFIGSGEWSSEMTIVLDNDEVRTYTPSTDVVINYLRIYVDNNQNYNNMIIKPMISLSNINEYQPYYRNMFGFSITSTNTSITSGLDYIERINSESYYYLPFDISENGKVSFNYTFPVGDNVVFNKIVINNKINGVSNNKLKLQYYYSNFSLGFKSMSFIDDVPSDNENWYGLIFQSDPPQIKIQSAKHSVYYANFKSEIYNFISQDDLIDHNDDLEYVQVLGFSSFSDSGNGKRTISFESLVCSSFGSGGGTYIPDNPSNDYESYLPVSGPFDFVPILTNAFTWIIYHVPIIGPIVNLFRSARVMFTSVVSLGELFSGFGIIFSIFIICLILYIIKKLYGGDN